MRAPVYCILRSSVGDEDPCMVGRCRALATERLVLLRPAVGLADGLRILILCPACAEVVEAATGDSRRGRKSRRRVVLAEPPKPVSEAPALPEPAPEPEPPPPVVELQPPPPPEPPPPAVVTGYGGQSSKVADYW